MQNKVEASSPTQTTFLYDVQSMRFSIIAVKENSFPTNQT